MRPTYTVGACSDRGRRKTVNEDAYIFLPPEEGQRHFKGLLLALADGMGGRAGGDQASKIAVNTLLKVFYKDASTDIAESLERAFTEAHKAVIKAGDKDVRVQGMATTLTAAVVVDDYLYHGHVGDSRAYIVEADAIRCITEDHSFVASLVKAGAITAEKARTHPQRNVITQAVGASEKLRIDISRKPHRLENGSSVLLCCDGLYKDLRDEEILEAIRKAPDPQAACETLITMANERGGSDNITAVMVRIDRSQAPANSLLRVLDAR